jgi:hypothetical protein
MPITYPLTLPTGDRFAVEFEARSVVALAQSPFTLQQQVQEHPGQIWLARLWTLPLTRAEADAWIAVLLALNGRLGTVLLGDPIARTPKGTAAGTPVVDGAGQTGQTLATTGWTPNQTGVLLRGDWLQVGTGTTQRLYKLLTDADADGSGEAVLDIWPRLRESPADEAPLVLTDPAGVFRLTHNAVAWSYEDVKVAGLELELMEAF